jgi:hypothetical protein
MRSRRDVTALFPFDRDEQHAQAPFNQGSGSSMGSGSSDMPFSHSYLSSRNRKSALSSSRMSAVAQLSSEPFLLLIPLPYQIDLTIEG